MAVFDRLMPTPNQLNKVPDVDVKAQDLLQIPQGTITEAGLRSNASVSIQYLAAWLGGLGCVPINNLMEDAATAEISRVFENGNFERAAALIDEIATAPEFETFITLPADRVIH